MKSRGGTLGVGGLDAPAFVARPVRALRGGSGRARALRDGWRRCGRAGCVQAGGQPRGIYSALTRHGSGRGTAAPRSVAR